MTVETGKATSELRLELTYDHGTGYLKPYFDGLLAGQAVASKCPDCGRAWFPPRAVCPDDLAETGWSRLSGSGVVVAATEARTKLPFTAATEAYRFVLVAMDGAENAVFGRMQDAAATVAVGARVELVAPVDDPGHPAQAAQFSARRD
ncbi:MAG: zinc ribbon domain-containing protein [Pseudomonadota bacterium]